MERKSEKVKCSQVDFQKVRKGGERRLGRFVLFIFKFFFSLIEFDRILSK
jgi:hypothetical protein